ncbi:hypothetical protein COCVIDRAFT_103983 [Bipolaris victoriae FI3]|uniref:Uncharacterized protein n=1 Tax=Bipolaris victoriae (strain FI3) TaxID=930091 RepID=W7ELP0_BIPV3|nr:hypothetical protein COCVIDRAFT_103983 [Bipolaris victoriae FI3]
MLQLAISPAHPLQSHLNKPRASRPLYTSIDNMAGGNGGLSRESGTQRVPATQTPTHSYRILS